MKLYEKIGFKKIEQFGIQEGVAVHLPEFIHGLYLIKYSFKIAKWEAKTVPYFLFSGKNRTHESTYILFIDSTPITLYCCN